MTTATSGFDNIIASNLITGNPTAGIYNIGASPLISGNHVVNNSYTTRGYGIYNAVDFGSDKNPNTANDDILSVPYIVNNVIDGNSGVGIMSIDTAPAQRYELLTTLNNVVTNSLSDDVHQSWYAGVEIVTGTVTNTIPIVSDVGVHIYKGDGSDRYNLGYSDEAEGSAIWLDESTATYANATSWVGVREFVIDADGHLDSWMTHTVRVDLGVVSATVIYPFDGLSNTKPLSDYVGLPNYQMTGPYARYQIAEVNFTYDEDGDGVPDAVEVGDDPTDPVDSDGDGVPDYQDPDSDGDGIPDSEEGYGDSDGDGVPDYQDPDDDGDGIPTEDEIGDDPENPVDSDGDGVPDYLDPDDDGDGIPSEDEAVECTPDPDDPDNDQCYCDETGCYQDTDDDGVPDYLDPDDDGDGIPSEDEMGECEPGDDNCICYNVGEDDEYCAVDTDGDGVPDYLDPDDDGDGIPSEDEMGECEPGDDNCICYNVGEDDEYCAVDTDGDGVPNYLDPDDDGDGIPTEDEDVDGDGDPTNDDTDGDGVPNYLDPIEDILGVEIDGLTEGTVGVSYTFTATVSSALTPTMPITYVWQIVGEAAGTPIASQLITDTFVFQGNAADTYTIIVTATNGISTNGGHVSDTQEITLEDAESGDSFIYLPLIVRTP
ncbi:MAG: hypothetical protein ACLFTI_02030 [Anaerolineales bacterium]